MRSGHAQHLGRAAVGVGLGRRVDDLAGHGEHVGRGGEERHRGVGARQADRLGEGVDGGADPHVGGAVGVDVVADDERAPARPQTQPVAVGRSWTRSTPARSARSERARGGRHEHPAGAARACRRAAGSTGRAGAGRRRRPWPPSAAASAAGPSRRRRRARRRCGPRGAATRGGRCTAPTASRRVGSTTPSATQVSSWRRRSSPAEAVAAVGDRERGLGLARTAERPRSSAGRQGCRRPRRARPRGAPACRRGRASASGRSTEARPGVGDGDGILGPGEARLDEPAEVGEVAAAPVRLAGGGRGADGVDRPQRVGDDGPAGGAGRAPPVDLGEDDAGGLGGRGRHRLSPRRARGTGRRGSPRRRPGSGCRARRRRGGGRSSARAW